VQAYRATINGENFLVEMGGSLGKYGFFTTRFVDAQSPQAAEERAIQIVWDEVNGRLGGLVMNASDDPPTVTITKIERSETLHTGCQPGLAWYEMNPKCWWQFWK
jgi:hypothetical protein